VVISGRLSCAELYCGGKRLKKHAIGGDAQEIKNFFLCQKEKEKEELSMDRKIGMLTALAVVFIIGTYGIAIGGGGAEDPACQNLPAPTSGPSLVGAFTVAIDKALDCTPKHYNIQLELTRGKEVHLFSLITPFDNRDICSYTSDEIKSKFARRPCTLRVGQAFHLKGVPVISELSITNADFCDNSNEAMISGTVVIRVVPGP
jgi:hypothetical protein